MPFIIRTKDANGFVVTFEILMSRLVTFSRKLVAFTMAIYVFNFSIDSRDRAQDALTEDLSYNDIESFYEFFTEDLLGIENAVEEHEEHDQEDGGSIEFKIDIIRPLISQLSGSGRPHTEEPMQSTHVEFHPSLLMEIDSPPPEIA